MTRRGYDPREVEAAFDRAAADYSVVVTDRDELARNELRAREQVAELQQELRDLASAPIDGRNLSARLRHMLELAQEEASEVRAHAHASATATVEQGRTQARAIHDDATGRARALAEQTDGAARARLAEASEQATATVVEAERQAGKLRREAEDARAEAARRMEAAEAQARELVSTAEAEAERLTKDAHAERIRLDEASQSRRAQTEHDFEVALTARRDEAAAALEVVEKDRQDLERTGREAQEAAATRLAATTAATEALEQHQREITARFATLRELVDRASAPIPERTKTPESAV
ncbi:DivIVA domain-containing protein [Actinomycetospora endophytica]|uniref:DivIVA domain-containing protein n=1 Tax=Actinomycetospora endophytica TaxID=2291215 RepID=A0ABS8PHA0_9PSEU|nr:DivIVA domain-containing protein [Actinomycetospora endophytica]MCD2196766.1 DivIVA domain-containing protein [Actinomycetospora endophytica]